MEDLTANQPKDGLKKVIIFQIEFFFEMNV